MRLTITRGFARTLGSRWTRSIRVPHLARIDEERLVLAVACQSFASKPSIVLDCSAALPFALGGTDSRAVGSAFAGRPRFFLPFSGVPILLPFAPTAAWLGVEPLIQLD